MATSNYDVNVQLALATTAEYEGDLDSAFSFLAEAHRAARADREAHAQVHRFTAGFRARHRARSMMKPAALAMFAGVF
jgi:hypothetical protein